MTPEPTEWSTEELRELTVHAWEGDGQTERRTLMMREAADRIEHLKAEVEAACDDALNIEGRARAEIQRLTAEVNDSKRFVDRVTTLVDSALVEQRNAARRDADRLADALEPFVDERHVQRGTAACCNWCGCTWPCDTEDARSALAAHREHSPEH